VGKREFRARSSPTATAADGPLSALVDCLLRVENAKTTSPICGTSPASLEVACNGCLLRAVDAGCG
jgi:hypothetical protein